MQDQIEHAVFATDVGPCRLSWRADGSLTEIRLLADGDPRPTVDSAPPAVRSAAERIAAHLGGQPVDLGSIRLSMDGLPPFHRRVYERARSIPAGQTTTYGALARALGSPKAARAVGQAMAKNPFLIVVPCHRVVGSSSPGGFSAPGGLSTKTRLLAIEGSLSADRP